MPSGYKHISDGVVFKLVPTKTGQFWLTINSEAQQIFPSAESAAAELARQHSDFFHEWDLIGRAVLKKMPDHVPPSLSAWWPIESPYWEETV